MLVVGTGELQVGTGAGTDVGDGGDGGVGGVGDGLEGHSVG